MSFGGGFGSSTPAASNFSFGANTSAAATPAKRDLPGFGSTSFGFGSSTPAATNTGLGTSVFGTPSTQPSAFGTTSTFGTPAATGFGAPSATSTTSTFSTATPGYSFGGTPASTGSTFGTAPGATATGFGSTLGAPTTTSSIGGFGGFGGFGTTSTANTPSTSLFGGFGATNTSTTPFGATSSGFGAFGAKPATSTGTTGFGTSFGTSGFGGFGSNLTQTQQQPQQQVAQLQQNPNALSEALYNAIFNCRVFHDERDVTIARWNLIQALWGTGKAYYALNAPPLELNLENPLCRFKAIGYSRMPETDNSEGLVGICFNKKDQEIRDGKQQLLNSLNAILGNKPNLMVTIDNIKSTKETKSQVTIFVSEKSATGTTRKIPANELVAYLSQGMQRTQLTQMGVENIFPQVKLDPSQLKEYLENPPCSINARLWTQAQLDNPNPDQYIPVPMIGFQQLKHRLKCQEDETQRYRAFLDMATDKIQDLQRQHTATQARLKEHRRTLLELQHKVLQILVRQEITRKVGLSLQPEEEVLTNRFEAMHSQISAPTQFKGRISEMLSQLRMRRHIDAQNQERYTMDPIAQDDIKTYLTMEQQGVTQLIDTINSDLECLKIIKDGMSKLVTDSNNTIRNTL